MLRDDSLYTHCMTAALTQDVFAHGQVYVGLSRCGDPNKLFVYGNLDANGERWVANPVYREILPKYT